MAPAKTVSPEAGAPSREKPSRRAHRWRGEFFSLGGLLAPFATTRLTLAPWAFSAAFLTVLASWDPVARSGEFDAILMGLAAYELLIGLTTERRSDSREQPSAARRPDRPWPSSDNCRG
jgi:hypothetical protein